MCFSLPLSLTGFCPVSILLYCCLIIYFIDKTLPLKYHPSSDHRARTSSPIRRAGRDFLISKIWRVESPLSLSEDDPSSVRLLWSDTHSLIRRWLSSPPPGGLGLRCSSYNIVMYVWTYQLYLKLPSLFTARLFWTFHNKLHNMKALSF